MNEARIDRPRSHRQAGVNSSARYNCENAREDAYADNEGKWKESFERDAHGD